MSNPRQAWERVGDKYYQKVQLYSEVFDPDLELENYIISGAPYSGALGSLGFLRNFSAITNVGCLSLIHI